MSDIASRLDALAAVAADGPVDLDSRLRAYVAVDDHMSGEACELMSRAADDLAGLRAALREALDGWDLCLAWLTNDRSTPIEGNPFMRIDDLRTKWRTGRPT